MKVNIRNQEVSAECTCPLRTSCKHCVALFLQWINEPASFNDAGRVLQTLGKKTKNELLALFGDLLRHHPTLLDDLAVLGGNTSPVDFNVFTRRIHGIIRGDLSYHSIHGVVRQLEPLKTRADQAAEQETWQQATEMYLGLIEGGIEAYEEGADDSDGDLGDFVGNCMEAMIDCTAQIEDLGFKDHLLEKVLPLVAEEDYGLKSLLN